MAGKWILWRDESVMNPLQKVQLGKTDLMVTRLGLGTTAVGGLYQDVDEEKGVATVRRALEMGLNLLDTAPLYGHGKAELRIGRAVVVAHGGCEIPPGSVLGGAESQVWGRGRIKWPSARAVAEYFECLFCGEGGGRGAGGAGGRRGLDRIGLSRGFGRAFPGIEGHGRYARGGYGRGPIFAWAWDHAGGVEWS